MKLWHAAVLGLLAALMATHWTTGWFMVGLAFLARWAWNLAHPRARAPRISVRCDARPYLEAVERISRDLRTVAPPAIDLRGFRHVEVFSAAGPLSGRQKRRLLRAWRRSWHRTR